MAEEQTLRAQVAERARHCCEYCQLPDHLTSLRFQVDHVIAEKLAGETALDNLPYRVAVRDSLIEEGRFPLF